jgi:asparagine synthase (glutamine-hydrolysing)
MMCGIAGSFGPRHAAPDRARRTLALMRRRGPDGAGQADLSLAGGAATLLHSRLAIVDLDPRADQPFELDGRVIAFNGEIYNHAEVRRDLEGLGWRFRTSSDTEVLLGAWCQWGTAMFDRLEGMWAFALVDGRDGTLVLARDRFGEKPLHVWWHEGTLHFGSEVKFLATLADAKPAVDEAQFQRFLVQGYRALNKRGAGWYRDAVEFPAGHYAVLRHPGLPAPAPYWTLRFAPQPMTAADALDGVRAHLDQAVRLSVRGDVPVAFCLSGGIDSSTLAGAAVKRLGLDIACFSIIDASEQYDERRNIEATIGYLGVPATLVPTGTDGAWSLLEELVAGHDGPVATITYLVHGWLCRAIHQAGYKVAIAGNGADEIFSGYYDHYGYWLAAMADRPDLPALIAAWQAGYGRFVRNPLLKDPLSFAREPGRRDHLLPAPVLAPALRAGFTEAFSERPYCSDLLRNRMLNELLVESVPVILREDDLNAMHWSIENRSPYLNRRLVEFLHSVPSEHLVGEGMAKWLLRSAGAGLVTDSVRLDQEKRGFNAAVNNLIDLTDPVTRDRLLAPGPIYDWVDRQVIEELVAGTRPGFGAALFGFASTRAFLDHHAAWRPGRP